MTNDDTEKKLLRQLDQLVSGLAPTGEVVSMRDRVIAGEKYLQLKQQRAEQARAEKELEAQSRAQQAHIDAEDRRLQLEMQRAILEAQSRDRELAIEEERLQIAKAEVVVKALEIAARNPEVAALVGIAEEMNRRLLNAPQPLPALEDKEAQE